RFKSGPQDVYPVWENVLLIRAQTDKNAWERARARAAEDEGDCSGTFTWEKRPAEWVCAGIRKVLKVGPPGLQSGTELTYSELMVNTEEELRLLARGDTVTVRYAPEPKRDA